MNNFLVTGAMGFIGSHWCEYLLKKNKKVIGYDINEFYPKLLKYKNFKFVKESIIENKKIEKDILKSDMVFHFASIAEPKKYIEETEKTIVIAALASLNLIDLCKNKNIPLFFTSTSEIYGKNKKIPFSEDDDRVLGSVTKKRWCYSSSKAIVEHYLHACNHSGTLDFIIVRLFNVYGPRLKGRVISDFLDKSQKNLNLTIYNGGQQTRSFTYVDDVMEAFYLLINKKDCLNQVFNVGSNSEIKIIDLAKKVQKITKNNLKILDKKYKSVFGSSYEDIERRVPNVEKIKKFIRWEAQTTLDDGIKKVLSYKA